MVNKNLTTNNYWTDDNFNSEIEYLLQMGKVLSAYIYLYEAYKLHNF